MSTELDIELAADVLELINELGKTLTFVADAGSYDPTTGHTTSSETQHSRKASPPLDFKEELVNGDTIQRGDSYIYVATSGLAFTPVETMRVVIDSESWRIVAVKKIYSGENVAAYKLHLRK